MFADDGGPRIVGLDIGLLEDDLALAVDLLGVEGGAERHVGQRLDGRLERLRGHDDVEVGVVEGGGGIGAAAHPFHRAIDVPRAPLVRALEQHVLLEVREAELIRLLVAHADAHVEVHGHDVGGPVVLDDQPEPVREHLADGRLQLARGRSRRGRRRRARRPPPVAARPGRRARRRWARSRTRTPAAPRRRARSRRPHGREPPPTDGRHHTGIAAPEIIPARSEAR